MKKNAFVWVAFAITAALVVYASAPTKNANIPTPTPVTVLTEPLLMNDGWRDLPYDDTDDDFSRNRHATDAFDTVWWRDDFEGSQAAWVSQDLTGTGSLFWHVDNVPLGDPDAPAWWFGDTAMTDNLVAPGGYFDQLIEHLISPTLNLSGATAPLDLNFKARWKVETPGGEDPPYDMWDGWNVWTSTDGGANWTVRQPVAPGYTGQNSFAWGIIWCYGPGIPAYGGPGNADAYSLIHFNFDDLIGQSNVKFRISFASDGAFSAVDDSSYYGLIVDSIRVTDGSAVSSTLLSNDGDATGWTSQGPSPSGNTWSLQNVDYFSPTTAWHASMDTSLLCVIESPPISLPDTVPFGNTDTSKYNVVYLSYYVWGNMLDSDGDNNSGLDDLWDIWVSADNGANYTQLAYDYGYNNGEAPPGGNAQIGWVKRTFGVLGGASQQLDLTGYGGQTIRLMIRMRTDCNDDGGVGQGLYIDDVEIHGIRAFLTDASTNTLVMPFPTTQGLVRNWRFNYKNEGVANVGNQLRFRLKFFRPDGSIRPNTVNDSNLFAAGNLTPNEDTVLTRIFTPDMTGSWRVRVESTYNGEQDFTNDTTYSPSNTFGYLGPHFSLHPDSNLAFNVKPAGQYELGYHMRDFSTTLINPRYVRVTPVADGIPAADVDTFDITQVSVMWNYTDEMAPSKTARLEFFEQGLDARTPGALFAQIDTEIDPTETAMLDTVPDPDRLKPLWWRMSTVGIPLMARRLASDFWICVSSLDTNATNDPLPQLLARVTEPQDTTDGHHFTKRLELLGQPILASPSRYLVQVLLQPTAVGAPAVVGNLVIRRAASPNQSNIVLTWGASANATGYKVWRIPTALAPHTSGVLLTPLPITATTYTDTGIVGDASLKYFYIVTAVN